MTYRTVADLAADLAQLPADVGRAVEKHLRDEETRPMVPAMRSRARGRMAQRAAGTIRYTNISGGGRVHAGGGGSLGAVLLAGTEYGARGNRKKTYARDSPNGVAHTVRRRTTRMFRPWVGKTGYWFWPIVRTDMRGLVGRSLDVMDEAVAETMRG